MLGRIRAMPAKLERDIDWPGIRAAAAVVGVREAARQAASHLPPDEQNRFVMRCLKRSEREGWKISADKAIAAARPMQARPMSSNVITGAEIVQNALIEDGNAVKTNAMRFARKVTAHAADNLTAEVALACSGDVKSAVQVAAIAGGWQQASEHASTVVNIALLGMLIPDAQPVVIDV